MKKLKKKKKKMEQKDEKIDKKDEKIDKKEDIIEKKEENDEKKEEKEEKREEKEGNLDKKEEKIEGKYEIIDGGVKNEEKIEQKIKNFSIEGSFPLMNSNDFNELINDFIDKKDKTNHDFVIIDNNKEKNQNNNLVKNIDNNIEMSSDEEIDNQNNYLSDDDRKNESDNDNEEETVVEIPGSNEKPLPEITNINNNNEKDNLKKDLDLMKLKIEEYKAEIPKLIGEEKYKYILDICSIGIKDGNKQEEVNERIEKFIEENRKDGNEEQLHNIYALFILECQYYKKLESFKHYS